MKLRSFLRSIGAFAVMPSLPIPKPKPELTVNPEWVKAPYTLYFYTNRYAFREPPVKQIILFKRPYNP